MLIATLKCSFSVDFKATINLPKTAFARVKRYTADELNKRLSKTGHEYYKWQQSSREDSDTFLLCDGPPFANGGLHIGHFMNKVLKDIALRVAVMKGKRAVFRPGWDCHGLPIEVKVAEKHTRDITEFRKQCSAYALDAISQQKKGMQEWGLMADYDNPYYTMQKEFEAEQLLVFAGLVERDLVLRELRPVYWSISSRTALAEAELEYKEIDCTAVFVAFPVIGIGNLKLLVFTTTPWTVPANQAIAINKSLVYCKAQCPNGDVLIVAKECIGALNSRHDLGLEWLCDVGCNDELLGLSYYCPPSQSICRVLGAPFVSSSVGTGLVHLAPSYGFDDFELCTGQGITNLASVVDDSGCFTLSGPLHGLSIFSGEGTAAIMAMLKDRSMLVSHCTLVHRCPVDWRTKQPVIVRAAKQWFIDVQSIKGKLAELADKIDFVPPSGGSRLRHMMNARQRWCISRQRAWGLPIPVFYNIKDGTPLIDHNVIRKVAEKVHRLGSDYWWSDSVNEVLCGRVHDVKEFRRSEETMDVWFDSGTAWTTMAPRCQADLVVEGSDQFRGWFQSSLITSAAIHGRAPHRTVISHGFVLDENMKKMSKSLGNVVNPAHVISKYGVDVLRLWVASSNYCEDVAYSDRAMNSFLEQYSKLRNTFRFILGNLHDYDSHGGCGLVDELDEMAVRRSESVLANVYQDYSRHDFKKGYSTILSFVTHDLSSFYFDVIKDRLYLESRLSEERRSAQVALTHIAVHLGKALAPLAPILVDEVSEMLKTDIARHVVRNTAISRDEGFEELKSLRRRVHCSSAHPMNQVDVKLPRAMSSSFKLRTLHKVLQCSGLYITDTPDVIVEKASGFKCPRCWMYRSKSVGIVCLRCERDLDRHRAEPALS